MGIKQITEFTVCANSLKYHHLNRSSQPEAFLGKGALKICSKVPGEHPCRSVISTKLLNKATSMCAK